MLSKEIRIGLPNIPKTVDTSDIVSIWQYYLLDQMTEQLLYLHKDDYYSAIAEKWEVSPDQKRYIFHLDKKAKFSDGSLITSAEVAFTLKRLILKTGLHWKVSNYLVDADKLKSIDDSIEGIEIIDRHKIALNLKQPYITIMSVLSMTETGILHPKQVNKKDLSVEKWDICSGAYSGKFINNTWLLKENPNRLKMKKKENAPTHAKFIEIKLDYDVHTMMAEGILDVFIPGSDYSSRITKLITSDTINHVIGHFTSTEYLHLNIRKAPFNDVNMRRSLLKAWYTSKLEHSSTLKDIIHRANQLYLPTSPGRLEEKEIQQIISKFKMIKSKNQKTVRCLIPPFYNEIPQHIKHLKKVLLSHNLNLEVIHIKDREELVSRVEKGNFDILLIYVSMSATELNLVLSLLFSDAPFALHDINDDITPLIKESSHVTYRLKEASLNKSITKKIINNAEIIPIHYLKMPYFYRQEFDLSAIDNYDNDFRLWEVQQITRKQTSKR